MPTPEDETGAEPRPGTEARNDWAHDDLETVEPDITLPPPPTAPTEWVYPSAATAVPPTPSTPSGPPMPPAPPAWGTHADDFTPAPEPHRTPARRLTAIVAIVALVLASAGIGAAVATAFDRGSRSFSSAIPNTTNQSNSNSNSSGSSSNTSGIDVNAIAAKVTPSVVNIFTTIGNTGEAAGTGIVISSDGKVLTNNHVIENSTKIRVQIGGKGEMHDATVVGYDTGDDVALVQIKDVSGLPAVKRGNVSDVHVGDPIVAIGNAQGRGGTPEVVSGEVAALNQSVTAGDGRGESETLHGMIQVQAAIRSGDSGGPLINADGDVIGMNTAASVGAFAMQSSDHVAFAIPITKAMSVVNEIKAGDETNGAHVGARGLLGVQVERDQSDGFNPFGNNSGSSSSGAVVADVQSGSPADDAGITSGDVIVKVDGKTISSGSELIDALAGSHPNDKVKVTWQDDSGNQHSATVRLTSGPPA